MIPAKFSLGGAFVGDDGIRSYAGGPFLGIQLSSYTVGIIDGDPDRTDIFLSCITNRALPKHIFAGTEADQQAFWDIQGDTAFKAVLIKVTHSQAPGLASLPFGMLMQPATGSFFVMAVQYVHRPCDCVPHCCLGDEMYDYKSTSKLIHPGDGIVQIVGINGGRVSLIISVSISTFGGTDFVPLYAGSPPVGIGWMNPLTTQTMPYRDYGPLIQQAISASVSSGNVTVTVTEVPKIPKS